MESLYQHERQAQEAPPDQSAETLPDQWADTRNLLTLAGKTTAVLALLGWLMWFSPFDDLLDRSGTPLAGDFVMFYVAGQVMADGNAEQLYDDQLNQQRALKLFPQMQTANSWPYRYPPTLAAILSPLGRLPFATAAAIFVLVQISLLMLAITLWRRELLDINVNGININGGTAWLWGCATAPLIIETLLGGQLSLLALACVSLAAFCLQREHTVLAGMALAISLYKPNVLWLVVLASCIARPRLLVGFLPTALLGALATAAVCGWRPIIAYSQLAFSLGSSRWTLETPYWKVHGLTPALQSLLSDHGRMASVLIGLSVAVLLGIAWRHYRLDNRLMFGVLLACNALFNPYVPIYDLVLLVPAGLYLGVYAFHTRLPISVVRARMLIGALFAGPHLSQIAAQQIGIQLFPLVLLMALAWYIWLSTRNISKLPRLNPSRPFCENHPICS